MDEQTILASLASKLALILPELHERQRRLVLGAEARALGRGGITLVARAACVSRTTVHAALAKLETLGEPDTAGSASERSRRPGGGRPSLPEQDPTLLADLDALVKPTTRGDPMSPLRWTCKSTRQLAAALQAQGHRVSHQSVAALHNIPTTPGPLSNKHIVDRKQEAFGRHDFARRVAVSARIVLLAVQRSRQASTRRAVR